MKTKRIFLIISACMLFMNSVNSECVKENGRTLVCCDKQTKVCCEGENWACTDLKNLSDSEMKSPNKTEVGTTRMLLSGQKAVRQSVNGTEAEVVRQVNEERIKRGLKPLAVSAELTAAARIRAEEIAVKFSHTRPDGTKWSTVSSGALGENIARGHSSPDRVMAAWLISEGHRKNILRNTFGSIGVCALQVNGTIYWVQLFGR